MSRYRPLYFPKNFLWGAATAAHQNEGNNTNNDFWAWEHQPGKTADATVSGMATDWWDSERKRAEADFDAAKAMGLNTLRLSLEWSRIEPQTGIWNYTAIDRYREMLTYLKQIGITPMVTLHHFTNPLWLAERGGWLAPGVIGLFLRYTNFIIDKLGDLCSLWCTINEPMVYTFMSHIQGDWSPGKQNFAAGFQVAAAMAKAHGVACNAIHHKQPHAHVGLAKHLPIFNAAGNNLPDKLVATWQDTLFNRRLFEAVYHGKFYPPLGLSLSHKNGFSCRDNFIGINYYGRHTLKFDASSVSTVFGKHIAPPHAEMWDAPWADREVYPHGLYQAASRIAAFGKPIYITENGLDDKQDTHRPRFLLTHLAAAHRAIQHGANIRGYYHWTLVDNYEWVEGWTTRFGLIAIDPATQQRTPRQSAKLYSQIAQTNAITPEIVEEYAPQAMESVFNPPEFAAMAAQK